MNLNPQQFKFTTKSLDKETTSHQLHDKTGSVVAYADINHPKGDDTVYVNWLKSHEEGKGHAQNVMKHVYDSYPDKDIHWQNRVSPASEHLYEKFGSHDAYGDRTTGDADNGEWDEHGRFKEGF
jgi:hypothetical protein